ncbi:MAG: hypothetical protein FD134_1563 [Gallionellaceae bacterium]|nr:MAG: hypothetical protein FD134_1563 [Gallionellaceae bacterium]
MKRLVPSVVVAICAGNAWAADFVDTAKVISSTPIYERVSEPKQECWTETVSSVGAVAKSAPVEERSIGGALVGGVVGGVVGSQIGQGTGNTVATAAGAIAGAIIGDRVANPSQGAAQAATSTPQPREERRCRQVENTREVIRGYNVTYRYNGQDVTTRLPYQPGSTVRVGVTVLGDSNAGDNRDSYSGGDVRDNRSRDNRERHRKDRGNDD